MGVFAATVETAFNVTEVMQHAHGLEDDLCEAEHTGETLWAIVHFWELLGNAAWVPRLMDIQRQRRLEALIAATPLSIYRNPLVPREESISAVTPGVVNALRERVAKSLADSYDRSSGQYRALGDEKLWAELEGEAAVDFTFRSVLSNFELRGCAMCGKWYEPQLSNRGRFCGPECRKRFNNLRNSKKEEQRTFKCASHSETSGMELFSGLVQSRSAADATPLRIGRYYPLSEDLLCLDCVERAHPEWARYIAPLVESRNERGRALLEAE